MTKQEQLKKEILEKTREYYELVHKPQQEKDFNENDKINYAGRVFDEKELVNLVDSSLDFWLTYGKYSKSFEENLSKFLGVKWSFLVNSGSSANLLAFYTLTSPLLKDRQIKRNDEVITVAAGFPTTVAPIVQYGAIPVFVDIELNHYNIDIEEIKKAITKKTKAIMIAHTLGNPFNLTEVKKLCDENNLWLIEDNCDALGSKYNDQYTGTFGDIGTSSFYPPHHITMGEGGAVYTNNPLLKKIILSMRDWGRDCWCESGRDNTCKNRFNLKFKNLPDGYDHKYIYSHFGFNLKATDLQAAIGTAQIDKIELFCKKRQENYNKLYTELKDIKNFNFMLAQENSEPSWFGFLITLKNTDKYTRNDISQYLENNNIQTRNLFAGNITKHPLFDSLQEDIDYKIVGDLNNTNKVMNDAFWVGVYPGMNEFVINKIIKTIKNFIKEFDG